MCLRSIVDQRSLNQIPTAQRAEFRSCWHSRQLFATVLAKTELLLIARPRDASAFLINYTLVLFGGAGFQQIAGDDGPLIQVVDVDWRRRLPRSFAVDHHYVLDAVLLATITFGIFETQPPRERN